MLTSLPVPGFGGEFRRGIPDGVPVLPELLTAAGYRTAAYSANPNCARRLGHARGFGTFVEAFSDVDLATGRRVHPDNPARIVEPDVLLDLALAEMEAEAVRPVFAYVHLLQPHAPYEPPEEHVRLFVPEGAETVPLDAATLIERDKKRDLPPSWPPTLRRHYDAHTHYVDEALGRFLDAMENHPRFSTALVAVISDHGEAFGEHGRILHNSSVYEEMIRIPLVLRPPGANGAPRRVSAPVDLIDLAPTLLGLAGAPLPDTFQGGDLLELAAAPDGGADRPLLSRRVVGWPAFSMRFGSLKLMRAWVGVQWKEAVFDLANDPGETFDASAADPAMRRRLSDMLGSEMRRLAALEIAPAPLGTIDAEELEILRSLGYTDIGDDPAADAAPGG